MISLRSFLLKSSSIRVISHRTHTNRDWKPGLYPKTEADRLKAAQKYGLNPADYRPISKDNSFDLGDYPEIVAVSRDLRDPYDAWNDHSTFRDYNEPIPDLYYELYQNRRVNPAVSYTFRGFLKKTAVTYGAVAAFILFVYLTPDLIYIHPAYPIQLPSEAILHGEQHYLFEEK